MSGNQHGALRLVPQLATSILPHSNPVIFFCDVLLTVHLSIILVINQLNTQNLVL